MTTPVDATEKSPPWLFLPRAGWLFSCYHIGYNSGMKSIPITQNRVSANVAHNIRILLEHRKMSQTDLAEKSRVGKMQISRYVNERTRCNVDDAMNIAEALDIDFALFVSTKMSHKDVAVFHRRRNSNFPVDYRRGITSCN